MRWYDDMMMWSCEDAMIWWLDIMIIWCEDAHAHTHAHIAPMMVRRLCWWRWKRLWSKMAYIYVYIYIRIHVYAYILLVLRRTRANTKLFPVHASCGMLRCVEWYIYIYIYYEMISCKRYDAMIICCHEMIWWNDVVGTHWYDDLT